MGSHRQVNRGRTIALVVLALNLVLVFLFPPYDYITMQHGDVPTFEGFRLVFAEKPNCVLNASFLALEVFVVLINFFIAWLLLGHVPDDQPRRTNVAQRRLLAIIGVNLVAIVLFPPFENFMAISKAILPSFEGFFFVFGDNSQRQIVVPLLYLEITAVLINGALLWLFLTSKRTVPLSKSQIGELAQVAASVQKH